MAVSINTLITGSMGVGTSSSSPSGHPETRFTLQNGTVETYNITGTLDYQWMVDNGYYDENNYYWLKNIVQVDIGNTVTKIGNDTFYDNPTLQTVMIPYSVEFIGNYAFYEVHTLTNVTFIGRTLEQVQNIKDDSDNNRYPWGITDTSIITVA